MNENTLSHKAMVTLQKVLIEQMVKITMNFASDFVDDLYGMNSLNEKGELTGKYIFMSRTNGTEFGRADDARLTHDWGYVSKKYEIDFDKLRQINLEELSHYSNILQREGTNHLSEFWVVKEIE